MDNLANDFWEEFQHRLNDFYVSFRNWWIVKTIWNNSYPNAKGIDIAYWFFMQDFAEKQVKQFVNKLPEKGKEFMDNLKKVVEQAEEKEN